MRPDSRRWPAILGGMATLAAIGWWTVAAPQGHLQPVLNGRQFSPVEQRQAVETLRAAGIESVRLARRQLLVSEESLAAADAALSKVSEPSSSTTQPTAPIGSILDQFSTTRRQEQATAAARATQVSRLLEQLPGVETAELVWDEEPRVGRRQPPRVRATVFLKPDPGAAIGFETVHAVRTAVAGSRAHLSAADVTVMDISRRLAYEPPADAAAYAAEAGVAQIIAACRRRLDAALADIPGIVVSVAPLGPPAGGSVAAKAPASTDARGLLADPSGPNRRRELASVRASVDQMPPGVPLAISVVVPTTYVHTYVAQHNPKSSQYPARRVAEVSRDVTQTLEAELRQRIDAAVGEVITAPAELTIQLEPSHSPPQSGVAPSPAVAWSVRPLLGELWSIGRARPWIFVSTFTAVAVAIGLRQLSRALRKRTGRKVTDRTSSPAHARRGRSAAEVDSNVRVAKGVGDRLTGIDIETWAPLAAREPVHLVAGLLPHLSPHEVAHVIAQLAPADQRQVLQLVPQASLEDQELQALCKRLATQAASSPQPPAVSSGIDARPRPRTDRVTSRMAAGSVIGFEDLAQADQPTLRRLAARIPPETWKAAFVAASPDLQRRLGNLGGVVGRGTTVAARKPLRLREIESAQRLIVDEWLTLRSQR
ncbi:MAG: hypothetical protein U0992_20660 [Planctomycetaceae bacterium]